MESKPIGKKKKKTVRRNLQVPSPRGFSKSRREVNFTKVTKKVLGPVEPKGFSLHQFISKRSWKETKEENGLKDREYFLGLSVIFFFRDSMQKDRSESNGRRTPAREIKKGGEKGRTGPKDPSGVLFRTSGPKFTRIRVYVLDTRAWIQRKKEVGWKKRRKEYTRAGPGDWEAGSRGFHLTE